MRSQLCVAVAHFWKQISVGLGLGFGLGLGLGFGLGLGSRSGFRVFAAALSALPRLQQKTGEELLGPFTQCTKFRRRIKLFSTGGHIAMQHCRSDASPKAAAAAANSLNMSSQEGFPQPITPRPSERAHAAEKERAAIAENAVFTISNDIVLYEDEWFLVINKPCGIYCEEILRGMEAVIGGGHSSSEGLSEEEGRRAKDGASVKAQNGRRHLQQNLHLVNRLDRDTSGIIMISKDRNVSRTFGHAYANRLVKKSYVALCFGQPPAWKEHSLVTGHGRSRHGLWRVYSHEDVGRSLPGGSSVKDMMTRLVILAHVKGPIALDSGNSHTAGGEEEGGVRGERGGKEEREERGRENGVFTTDASSQQVLSERDPVLSIPPLKPSPPQEARPETKTETEIEVSPAVHSEVQNESNFFLVRAFPLTGRTHQIRMHCQLMGMPIAGDVRYGGPEAWSWGDMVWHAHALHAESVSFVHPVNVTEVNISAPLPEWASRAFHSKG